MSNRAIRQKRQSAIAAAFLLLGWAVMAQAQTTTTTTTLTSATRTSTAHVIEWDLTQINGEIDANPGAMAVDTRGEDNNRIWFVTRVASPDGVTIGGQRVYRFNPAKSLWKAQATWTSWDLRVDSNAGGLKIRPTHDRRFVVVRTPQFIQRIDTQTCVADVPNTCRTVWTQPDTPLGPLVSDIAVDDRNRIFTVGASVEFDTGYLQLLDPAARVQPPDATLPAPLDKLPFITVTRWLVGGGAGQCISGGLIGMCNAGIDVRPTQQNLVYYVEPFSCPVSFGNAQCPSTGAIAELNITINASSPTAPLDAYGKPVTNVRRWFLADLQVASCKSGQGCEDIAQPRTLKIDRNGRVWINTASGHLVSLDPNTNKMTKHQIPGNSANDPWGIAPDDDVIGYTATGTNKVAMLFPKFKPVPVPPVKAFVQSVPFQVAVENETANPIPGSVPGDAKVVKAMTTPSNDGTYVEAFVNTPIYNSNPEALPSMEPLGITPNKSKAEGTFFYTVGFTGDAAHSSVAKRVGFVRLPNKERINHPRDDDDADDGFDRTKYPAWHNSEPGDDDADGVPDQYDTPNQENMTGFDPAPIPAMTSSDYAVSTTATSLALIATAEPDNLTATMAVDVYNSLGTLVGTSGPMVGIAAVTVPAPGAGNFTVRVRNLSGGQVNHTPSMIVREPLVP